uniref:Uncharacterized protein n=1 Tax=Elaeophora elaphi TaxID=1147741 RepID=A0A0R3RUN1_9BILA
MTTYHFIRMNRKCKDDQRQQQQQQQREEKNLPVNTGLAPFEKTCSKLNVSKSRAIHDSNIDNPYVSFTFQEGFTNNGLK